MRKLFVLLLCILALFAVVSCKNEPKNNSQPSSEPNVEPEDDATVFVLTATAESDRFQVKWDSLANSGGKDFVLMYKSDKVVTKFTTRDPSASSKYVDCAAIATYISEDPEDNGWITFSFTIPEGEHTGFGIAFFVTGGVAIGDVFKIKTITLSDDEDDVELTLVPENAWAGCLPTITVEEKQ